MPAPLALYAGLWCRGWGRIGPGGLREWRKARLKAGQRPGLPWEQLLASYLLSCQLAILLLLLSSLMKLVFGFWDS